MSDPIPELAVGDIVQLDPVTCLNPVFAGCMMVVTEPKSWGAVGYVHDTGANGESGGQAYYRAQLQEFERTGGRAVWMVQ